MEENFSLGSLPYNNEAEQSVLGCVFVDPQSLITVAENLTPDDFYVPQNKIVYSAMLDLWNRGEAVDSITVTKELGKNLVEFQTKRDEIQESLLNLKNSKNKQENELERLLEQEESYKARRRELEPILENILISFRFPFIVFIYSLILSISLEVST